MKDIKKLEYDGNAVQSPNNSTDAFKSYIILVCVAFWHFLFDKLSVTK